MARLRLATIWLGGCSGCHMSFLDLDEFLIELASKADLVYSPILDVKVYPENVDAVLVEGAICNTDHLEMIHRVRRNTKLLISFGDCAVTGNVTALRNSLHDTPGVLHRSYIELADLLPQVPSSPGVLPPLLDVVRPVHQVVPVDIYLPGCPPPADRIRAVLDDLLAGRKPVLTGESIRFG